MTRKLNILLFASIFFHLHSQAQTNANRIEKAGENFYLMYYDTSAIKKSITKSAIVEFEDFIALLEMPIATSNTNLSDHSTEGENVLQTLQEYFPDKPLKYLISSHWHPHSISAVAPFISKGIKVITTASNFEIIQSIVNESVLEQYKANLIMMENDTMVIEDATNQIVLYKIKKSDYSYLPTEDFIYTYMPRNKYLQTSCMYQRFKGSTMRGKEMVSGRVENLYDFIQAHRLDVTALLCTDIYFDGDSGLIANDTLTEMMKNGLGMLKVENELVNLEYDFLKLNRDSLFRDLVVNPIPYAIINRAIVTNIQQKRLKEALELAQLLSLLNPSDPSSWDTLGEIYYFLGEIQIARKYQWHCSKIDPEFTDGGIEAWEKDKVRFGINLE